MPRTRTSRSIIRSAGVLLALAAAVVAGCGGGDEPRRATEVILASEQEVSRPQVAEEPETAPAVGEIEDADVGRPSVSASPPVTTADAGSAPSATESGPAASAVGSAAPETTGTEFARFSGRVTVGGPPPQLPPLVREGQAGIQDAVCTAQAVPDDSVRVGDNGGLADVFIYAKRVPSGVDVPPPPEEPVVLDQQGCRFIPQALVFQTEQPLQMINSDPVAHNVRTAGFTQQINQIIPPSDREGITIVYEDAERIPVQTKCDIHTWMSAYHMPVDHPWAVVSGEDGTFVIDGIPAGDWEFIVWHSRGKYIERSVRLSLAPGQVATRDFVVPASNLRN